jgi:pyruvate dehydrogenase E1 component
VKPADMGRMIALLGDAELDEGNIYEALIEAAKHDVRNCWWIVDYNRQSLDATTSDRMFARYDEIFRAAGWKVHTLKYSKRQREVFKRTGGAALQAWLDACPNDLHSALTYQGGAAFRERLNADLAGQPETLAIIADHDDEALHRLMAELGGHCIESLLELFALMAKGDTPRLVIAYTVKGWRLPFQGHKDNHSGLMTPGQITELRDRLGVREGEEWDAFSGLEAAEAESLRARVARSPFAQRPIAEVRRGHRDAVGRGAAGGGGGRRASSRPRPPSARSCSRSPRARTPLPAAWSPPRRT